jgi:phosphate-selective porin OprO/OprP
MNIVSKNSLRVISFVAVLICLLSTAALAQDDRDMTVRFDEKKGISITKDSLFQLNLRFRMQNRFSLRTFSGENHSIDQTDFRVRRMRLRFDGYVLNPKIKYYVQLGFSKADLDLDAGTYAQPIRDAIVYYYFTPDLYIGFGQTKLPGNRERQVSSGSLQFADRSIANGVFTLDRDFGFFGYYTLPTKGVAKYQIKGAVSTGEGRNPSPSTYGLSYTGRFEYLPFGNFKNSGDYSEGDLEFEETPKLSLALAYNWNEHASRSKGQTGSNLYENRDQRVIIADAMFKYAGWGVMAEYFNRHAADPVTENSAGLKKAVWVGEGANFHLSKMVSRKSEVALRYALVNPDQKIDAFEKYTEEAVIGYSRYIKGHRVKIQGNFGYGWFDTVLDLEDVDNFWFGTLQVEFGI